MITFLPIYESRKEEIVGFLELIRFFEKTKTERDGDGISEFDKIFYNKKNKVSLTYQSMINIMKSNLLLMIYNLIEYTTINLFDSIYNEIKINNLSYRNVNEEIRKLWRKTILKRLNDPSSNFETILRMNENIINEILENNVLILNSRDTIKGGNIDGNTLIRLFKEHGIQFATTSKNFRLDILENIKIKRNELSHGAISFVEAERQESIDDIEKKEEIIFQLLDELIHSITIYLNQELYKHLY